MGCGKTTVGKVLAKTLGYSFVDLDELIEQTEGRSIPQIFKDSGEEYFRDLETKSIKSFGSDTVIALGGGAVLRKENALAAKAQGELIYIETKFDTCFGRIKGDSNRPLASNASYDELCTRYNSRAPIYEAACSIKISGEGNAVQIANAIIEKVRG